MTAANFESSSYYMENNNSTFENHYKKHLSWNRKQWIEAGLINSKWHRHLSFTKYWNGKLKNSYKDNVIILSFYHPDKDYSINIEKILDSMEKIIPIQNITGIFNLRNTKLIGFEFIDIDSKKKIEEGFKYIGEFFVSNLAWAQNDGIVELTIHWLPTNIPNEKITSHLINYMTINSFERETVNMYNRLTVKTGKIFVQGKLKEKVQIEELPHFVIIDSLQALITIRGRAPLCLSCEGIGHIAATCPTPYCGQCRQKQPKSHTCIQLNNITETYSQKLKDNMDDYNIDEDQANHNPIANSNDPSSQTSEMIIPIKKTKHKSAIPFKDSHFESSPSSSVSQLVNNDLEKEKKRSSSRHAPYNTTGNKTLSALDNRPSSLKTENTLWSAELSSSSDSEDQQDSPPFIPQKKNKKTKNITPVKTADSRLQNLRSVRSYSKVKKNVVSTSKENIFKILDQENMDVSHSTSLPHQSS